MYRSEDLYAEAQAIAPRDLLDFLPQLLARLHVDVLYHVRFLFPPPPPFDVVGVCDACVCA